MNEQGPKRVGGSIWKRILFHFTAATLILLTSMCLMEIALRAVVHFDLYGKQNAFSLFIRQFQENTRNVFGKVEKTGIFQLSEDPSMGWEPIPGTSVGHIRINSAGFRGQEVIREAGPGITRVVFLGDSETFGLSLKQDETLPGCLEKALNGLSRTQRYEVLNFGVPGYNTAQEFEVLRKKAMHFNPSIVVLYYVLNDPLIANPLVLIRGGILSRSYLYLSIVYLIKSIDLLDELDRRSPSLFDLYQRLHHSQYFEAVKRVLHEMGDYLEARGVRFILLIAPEVIGFPDWKQYPYMNIHGKLKRLSSKKIHVLDPLDYVASRGHKPEEFWITPYDCHKNAKANNLIALFLAEHIAAGLEKNDE